MTDLATIPARDARKPRHSRAFERTVVFPADVLDALAPHAARRNIHPNSLARRIVEQAIDSNLVDAILDDDGGKAR